MARWLRARWLSAAALLLIAGIAGGVVEDLIHTDDGCAVEIHCLACQRTLASVGVVALPATWSPSIELVGRIVAVEHSPTHEPDSPTAGARAPPLA
jgi:hypothetical protein